MNHERHIHLSGFPYRIPLTNMLLGHEEVTKFSYNQTDGSKVGLLNVGFWDRLERAQFDTFEGPKDCINFIQKTEDSFLALCNRNSSVTWFSSRGTTVSAVSQIGVEKQRLFFEFLYARKINRIFTLRKDVTVEGARMIALAVYSTQSPINYSRQLTYNTSFTSMELKLSFFDQNENSSYVVVYQKGGPARIEYFQYRSSGAIMKSIIELDFGFPQKTLQGVFREYAVLLNSDGITYEVYLLSPDPKIAADDQVYLQFTFLRNITTGSEYTKASMGLLPGTMKKFDIYTEDLFWMISGRQLHLFGKNRTPTTIELSCSFNGPIIDGSWRLLGMDLTDPINRLFLLHNTSHALVMQRNFGFVKALETDADKPVEGIGAILLNGKRSPSILTAKGEILDFHSEQLLEINFDHSGAFAEDMSIVKRSVTLEFITKQHTAVTVNLTLNIVENFRSLHVGELFKPVHVYDNEMNTKSVRTVEIPADIGELMTSLPRFSMRSDKIPGSVTVKLDQIDMSPDYCMAPDPIVVTLEQSSEYSMKVSSTLSSKSSTVSQVYPGYLLKATITSAGAADFVSVFAIMVRYSPSIKGPFQHPYLVHIRAEANSLPEVLMPLPVNIGTNASSVVSISAISTSMVSIILKRGRRYERVRYSLDTSIPTSSYYYDDDCETLVAHSADNTVFEAVEADTAGQKMYLLYRGTELFNVVAAEFQNATFRNSSSGWIYGSASRNAGTEGFVIMHDSIDIARVFFIPDLGIKNLKLASKEGYVCLKDDSPLLGKWVGIRYTGPKLIVDIKPRSGDKNTWPITVDVPIKLESAEYPKLKLNLSSGLFDYSLKLQKPAELPVLSKNLTSFKMEKLLSLNSSVTSINFRSDLPATTVSMSCFLTKRSASEVKRADLFKESLLEYEGKTYQYLAWDKHTEALILTQDITSSGVVFAVRNLSITKDADGKVIGTKTANVLGVTITSFKPLLGTAINLVRGLHRSVYAFFFCEVSNKIHMLTVRDVYSVESKKGIGLVIQSSVFSPDCPVTLVSNPICTESHHRRPFISCALRCNPSRVFAFEVKLFSQSQTQIGELASFTIPPEITSVNKLFVLPTLKMVVLASSLKAYYYSMASKSFVYTDNYINSEQPDWIVSHGTYVMYRLQNKEERFFEIFKDRVVSFDYNSSVAVKDWSNVFVEVVGLKEDQVVKYNIEDIINIRGDSNLSYYLLAGLGVVILIGAGIIAYFLRPKSEDILQNEEEQEKLDMYASMTEHSDFTREPSKNTKERDIPQRKSRSEKDMSEDSRAFDIDDIQKTIKKQSKVL